MKMEELYRSKLVSFLLEPRNVSSGHMNIKIFLMRHMKENNTLSKDFICKYLLYYNCTSDSKLPYLPIYSIVYKVPNKQ